MRNMNAGTTDLYYTYCSFTRTDSNIKIYKLGNFETRQGMKSQCKYNESKKKCPEYSFDIKLR